MHSRDVLQQAFDQVADAASAAVSGLSEDDLARRLGPTSNSLAWLVWHLTRVQDDHVADAAGTEQVWTAQGWADRAHLPFGVEQTGYGFDDEQVGQVRLGVELLLGYLAAVHARTAEVVAGLEDDDLDRVVDTSYDPPVTLGVRLGSVVADDLQHAGQAAFLRGVLLAR